jgi:hypothetical protein
MSTSVLTAAVQEVLDDPEVTGALAQVAEVAEASRESVRDELKERLLAAQEDCERLVTVEMERYADAVAAVENLRQQLGLIPAESEALRDAREAATVARQHVERSRAHLQAVLAERTRVMSQLEQEQMRKQIRQTLESMSASSDTHPVRKRRVPWSRKRTSDDVGARRVAVAEKIEAEQRRHQALTDAAAAVMDNLQQFEKREARRLVNESSNEPEEVLLARERVEEAERGLRQALVEKALLPMARELLTEALAATRLHRYRLDFDTPDTSGLRQMSAPEHELPTVAFDRLAEIMDRVGGGAIGVSGPRGVGKSTLLRWACTQSADIADGPLSVGVVVPVPVIYAPREFVLHLYASLCRRVLREAKAEEEPVLPAVEKPRRAEFLILGVAAALSLAGIVAGGGVAAATRDAFVILWILLLFGTVALSVDDKMCGVRGAVVTAHMGPVLRRVRIPGAMLLGVISAVVVVCSEWPLTQDEATWFALAAGGVALLVGLLSGLPSRLGSGKAQALGALLTVTLLVARQVRGLDVPSGYAWAVVVFILGGLSARAGAVLFYGSSRWTSSAESPAVAARSLGGWSTGATVVGMWFLVAPTAGWNVPLLAAGSALLLGAGIALWRAVTETSPERLLPGEHQAWGLASDGWDLSRDQPPGRDLDALVRRTRKALEKIQYQQTLTRGWSEAIKLGAIGRSPISVETGQTGGDTLARVALTYPEVVASFHEYLRDLSGHRDRSGHGFRVVIGIDELDKMSAELASQFLNDVKGIFDGNVPGCYFLVSVSEEAMASFQQRGLPTRNVFDTAFDEMLHVDYLDYVSTVAMLGRRIINLPRGVAALCHALAGGLPRDVIRTMRAVVEERGEAATVSLAALTDQVCARELRSRIHGLRTELVELDDWRAVVAIQNWTASLRVDDLCGLDTVPDLGGQDQSAALRLLRLHAASFYHLATVRDVLETADEKDLAALENGGIDDLARARQAMATNWALSVERVSGFRRQRGLPVPSAACLGTDAGPSRLRAREDPLLAAEG